MFFRVLSFKSMNGKSVVSLLYKGGVRGGFGFLNLKFEILKIPPQSPLYKGGKLGNNSPL